MQARNGLTPCRGRCSRTSRGARCLVRVVERARDRSRRRRGRRRDNRRARGRWSVADVARARGGRHGPRQRARRARSLSRGRRRERADADRPRDGDRRSPCRPSRRASSRGLLLQATSTTRATRNRRSIRTGSTPRSSRRARDRVARGEAAVGAEHVTPFLGNTWARSGRVGARAIYLSGQRWTVDEPRDLELVRAVYAAMGDREDSTSETSSHRSDARPELRASEPRTSPNGGRRDLPSRATRAAPQGLSATIASTRPGRSSPEQIAFFEPATASSRRLGTRISRRRRSVPRIGRRHVRPPEGRALGIDGNEFVHRGMGIRRRARRPRPGRYRRRADCRDPRQAFSSFRRRARSSSPSACRAPPGMEMAKFARTGPTRTPALSGLARAIAPANATSSPTTRRRCSSPSETGPSARRRWYAGVPDIASLHPFTE